MNKYVYVSNVYMLAEADVLKVMEFHMCRYRSKINKAAVVQTDF